MVNFETVSPPGALGVPQTTENYEVLRKYKDGAKRKYPTVDRVVTLTHRGHSWNLHSYTLPSQPNISSGTVLFAATALLCQNMIAIENRSAGGRKA